MVNQTDHANRTTTSAPQISELGLLEAELVALVRAAAARPRSPAPPHWVPREFAEPTPELLRRIRDGLRRRAA